jgi:hypothetical protein
MMLDGNQPKTDEDWGLLVNFYSVNIAKEVQPSAVVVIAMIMGCPLPRKLIEDISAFHAK